MTNVKRARAAARFHADRPLERLRRARGDLVGAGPPTMRPETLGIPP